MCVQGFFCGKHNTTPLMHYINYFNEVSKILEEIFYTTI